MAADLKMTLMPLERAINRFCGTFLNKERRDTTLSLFVFNGQRGIMNYSISLSVFGLAAMISTNMLMAKTIALEGSAFSFETPPAWKYITHKPDNPRSHFQILDAETKLSASVLFHYTQARPNFSGAVIQQWEKLFSSIDTRHGTCSEKVTMGHSALTYVEIEGVLRDMKGKPKRIGPTKLFGAIIPDGSGGVLVRMIGPQAVVDGNKSSFRGMVDAALKKEVAPPAPEQSP